MKPFLYQGKEVVLFAELLKEIQMPRATLVEFIANGKLKSYGKIGHKIMISVDDLKIFLNSKFYKDYLVQHPYIKPLNFKSEDLHFYAIDKEIQNQLIYAKKVIFNYPVIEGIHIDLENHKVNINISLDTRKYGATSFEAINNILEAIQDIPETIEKLLEAKNGRKTKNNP